MQGGSGQCIVNYTGTQKFIILIVGSETLGTLTKFLLVGSINDYASLPTDDLKGYIRVILFIIILYINLLSIVLSLLIPG